MKRGLFLLATVTLSSALYAQNVLTAEQARKIVADFNPQLLERASQNSDVSQLVDELISSYLAKQPVDNLANRYNLVALARNFDNSLALYDVTEQYQQAVRYSALGGDTEHSARQYAQTQLREIFSRIWAVSVQTKEELLAQYKSARRALKQEGTLPADQKAARLQAADQAISALNFDLKNLKTNTGEHITDLVQNTLDQARTHVLSEQTSLRETTNLQIKTKHKKPVAE